MITLYEIQDVLKITDNIFTKMRSAAGPTILPWDTFEDSGLWMNYLYGRSGEKLISPLVNKLTNGETITSANLEVLATILLSLYVENWNRAYDTFFAEYEALHNYDRTETKTGSDTVTDTPTNWEKETVHGQITETMTDTPTNWEKETVHGQITETMTDTPTNWEKETVHGQITETMTDTPTNWEKETVHGQITETMTDTPTNWEKETVYGAKGYTDTSLAADNEETVNRITYGFNSSNPVPEGSETTIKKSKVAHAEDQHTDTETQNGTYEKETVTTQHTDTETQNGTYEKETVTTQHTDTETQNGTYEKETVTTQHTDTETQNGTYEKETVTTQHTDTETLSGTYEKETEYGSTIRAYGNIGVTTTQQMLQAELDLRSKSFFDLVYKNLDETLTIDIY